jgi:hypothetical protein
VAGTPVFFKVLTFKYRIFSEPWTHWQRKSSRSHTHTLAGNGVAG